jgi:hypothetical protein
MALGPKHVVAVTTEEEEEVFPLTVSLWNELLDTFSCRHRSTQLSVPKDIARY